MTRERGTLHHNEVATDYSGYTTSSLKLGNSMDNHDTQKIFIEDLKIFRKKFEGNELEFIMNRHRFRIFHHDLGEPSPEPEPEPEALIRLSSHYDFVNTTNTLDYGYNGVNLTVEGTVTQDSYGVTLPSSTVDGGSNYLYSPGFKLGGTFSISIWFKPGSASSPGGNNLINFGNYGNCLLYTSDAADEVIV